MSSLATTLPALGATAGDSGTIPIFSKMTSAGPAQFGLSVPGTIAVLGAGAKFLQGQQQASAAEYNAELAERQARYEEAASAAEANRLRRRGKRVIGSQRAAYGASGVTPEGSPLLVMEETARDIELDAQNILYGGDVRARGSRGKAKLSKWEAKRRRGGSLVGAGTYLGRSLLTQSRSRF